MSSDKPLNKLAKGSYFLILDNFANLGVGAIFWLILAKLTDPGVIGQAMVVTTFATTIIGFTGYGIQVTLSKYLSEYNAKNMPNTARHILKNGIRASLLMSGAVAFVICLLSGQISTLAYKDSTLSLLLIFTISTFLPTQTIIAALIGAFTGVHFMKYAAITDSIFQAARMGFAIIALLYGLGTFGILLGFTIASFIALAFSYFYLLPRAIPKSSAAEESPKEGVRHIVKFTSFNYISMGFNMLSHQLGILVLGTQSFEWAAFYGLALLISKVVGSFSHSVGSALLPTASEQWAKGDKTQVQKIVNTAMRISILISGFGFIILMIDPSYFLGLLSDSYVQAGWALRILAISAVLTAITSILTSIQNAASRASDVAKIGIISSIVTIALTFVLMHIGGIEGVAIALCTGTALRLALSLILLKQKDDMVISLASMVKPFIAIMSGLLVGYIFVLWDKVLLGVIVAIACYAVFCMVYKVTSQREVKQLIKMAVNPNK